MWARIFYFLRSVLLSSIITNSPSSELAEFSGAGYKDYFDNSGACSLKGSCQPFQNTAVFDTFKPYKHLSVYLANVSIFNVQNPLKETQFNSSSKCITPLSDSDNLDNCLQDVAGFSNQCRNPVCTENYHIIGQHFIRIIACLSVAFTAVNVVTFVVNWIKSNRHPTKILFYKNLCWAIVSFGLIVQIFPRPRKEIVCMDDGVQQGLSEYGPNLLNDTFVLIYFIGIATAHWFFLFFYSDLLGEDNRKPMQEEKEWIVFCLLGYFYYIDNLWLFLLIRVLSDRVLDFKRESQAFEDLESCSQEEKYKKGMEEYYLLCAWNIPFSLHSWTTPSSLHRIISEVDGNSLSIISFFGFPDTTMRLLGVAFLLGGYLLALSLLSVAKVILNSKEVASNQSRKTFLDMMLTKGLIALCFVLHFCVSFSFFNWDKSDKDYVNCLATNSGQCSLSGGGSSYSECVLRSKPNLLVFSIHFMLIIKIENIITSLVWDKYSVLEKWKSLLERVEKFSGELLGVVQADIQIVHIPLGLIKAVFPAYL